MRISKMAPNRQFCIRGFSTKGKTNPNKLDNFDLTGYKTWGCIPEGVQKLNFSKRGTICNAIVCNIAVISRRFIDVDVCGVAICNIDSISMRAAGPEGDTGLTPALRA